MGFTCGRSGEICSKRSARNSEPSEYAHIGERQSRASEFSAVGTGQSPKERHRHLWSTRICLCYKIKKTQRMCLLVHAHHQLLRNATALRCPASLLVAMSTAFAHFKCKRLSGLHLWSEWRDLNSRPLGPEPSALPNCATPRKHCDYNLYSNFLQVFCIFGCSLPSKLPSKFSS